ncbi:DUF4861 domain-containing protein [Horticoccus luteus]|uniref:DUF4861 domain-containing protein n=1 Tax=Horticoccus luteus TaxID=2862869 RepID=A0A8F9TSR3_9BACT|nr:DUF4861 family protein [Horticoccus luteus]QYM78539.1 DUF4861 domain-containing protein [Horticoccus luteus]
MKLLPLLLALAAPAALSAADQLVVTVTHDLAVARPAETISVPWADVNRALPHAMMYHLAVKDAAGHVLPYQVTNINPTAKDPQRDGGAYGELLFQHDFAPGEKSATFTVEKIAANAPLFPTKVFARYVPERLDDFAWENDKVAHRIYGPALAAPAAPGSGKEVLVTSGVDLWVKRVSYPVVDRWYNKGHDYYHHFDLGEGADLYNVGTTRGCGGTGIWDGHELAIGRNYRTWTVLANGPVRAIFELTYDAWDAHGRQIAETKRFTVDAGHYLDQIDSTFTVTGDSTAPLTVAIGLNKTPSDKGEDPTVTLTQDADTGVLAQWLAQKIHGGMATGIIVPPGDFAGFAEDARNLLVLAHAKPGAPLRYYVGGAWSEAGEITDAAAWKSYLTAESARLASPVRVALSTR